MNTEEKFEKLKKLADAMYYAAQNLTTDASRLHKAMDEYHKFIINEYHKEEPVSEMDFEQELYKYFGQVKDFTLGMRIAKRFYEIGRNHQEPISDDLEEAARKYAGIPEDSPHDLKYCVQDKKAKYDAVLYGANWQKEQMIAEAVDAVVKIDAGGYPYIPQIELYDYDKDKPLAKEGDVVKVLIIKKIEL